MPDFSEQLKEWGKKRRFLFARNDELKQLTLSKLPPEPVEGAHYERRRIPWLSFALVGIAIIIFFVAPKVKSPIYEAQPMSSGGFGMPNALAPAVPDSFLEKALRPVFPGSPITDTREFLKTDYYSTIRTRHAQELASRIQIIVRGFGGRVDSASSGEKYGLVSFAVPADKLDAFRNEIRGLVNWRFYEEQLSSQNLLPQKQSIEEQQASAQTTLDNLKADRDKLITDHKRIVASLNSQINAVTKELAALRAEVTNDPARRAQIDARIAELVAQENNLRARLANENRDYQSKLASLDEQIKYQESILSNLDKENQNLLDNVATVNGTISLSWISIWETLDLYLPGPLLAWLLLVAAALAFLYHHRIAPIIIPSP